MGKFKKEIEENPENKVIRSNTGDLLSPEDEWEEYRKTLSEFALEIVKKDELAELVEQNMAMKTEIGQLIGLFKNFEGLLSGKTGAMGLIALIPKLINSPEIKNQIEAIYPIIEKYSE